MSKRYKLTESQLTFVYESLMLAENKASNLKEETEAKTAPGVKKTPVKEWEKVTGGAAPEATKHVKGSLKSQGSNKNIEGTKATVKTWEEIKPGSGGTKDSPGKSESGVKKPAEKAPEKATTSVAPEAKKDIKGSLKNQGAEKKIEGAKATTKPWEEAKKGSVNETRKESTPSQMREQKKNAMEELAKKMDEKGKTKK